jgi:hypothetical protein
MPHLAGKPCLGQPRGDDRPDLAVPLDREHVGPQHLWLLAERPEEVVDVRLDGIARHGAPDVTELLDFRRRACDLDDGVPDLVAEQRGRFGDGERGGSGGRCASRAFRMFRRRDVVFSRAARAESTGASRGLILRPIPPRIKTHVQAVGCPWRFEAREPCR